MHHYKIIVIIAIILIAVAVLIVSLNVFGPREEGNSIIISGPNGTSISVPPSVAASGVTFTIQQLDALTAPELPEWVDNVISLYDFSADQPIHESVTLRIPIPDVELAVLCHYSNGNWSAMFFEEEDGKAVVEADKLSLFAWLDVNVSMLSDKFENFLTLRWMEKKPSLSADPGMSIDESSTFGLISGGAHFINENEVELLVYNNAPLHLEVYPISYPSGKTVKLQQTSIYASGDRIIIAPRSSALWTVQLTPGENVIFEAYFSDTAVVALMGDLIPLGKFARGIVESSLFASNGRMMTWGDIKGLLIIPKMAEFSKTVPEVGEMPILETARITFTCIDLPEQPVGNKGYTMIYLLDSEGGRNLPANLRVGENCTVILGVENHEYKNVNYRIVVRLDNETIATIEAIKLAHEEKWQQNFTFTPEKTGEMMKLEFLLYREGEYTGQYVSLRINVRSVA
jgi:hypothetical protein